MKVLVTGGAGFIGRWVVKMLLDQSADVWVLDNLANGSERNLSEFASNKGLKEFRQSDIKDKQDVAKLFEKGFDVCYHMAASINVQDSIDRPSETFDNDVVGTFNVLDEAHRTNTRLVFMSTCMVYDRAGMGKAITEEHATKAASPYAGSKLAGEYMVQSFYHAYGLPTVVVRPFNTYGPFQKSSGDGGVVAIFIKSNLTGEDIRIYGDGTQTRDLLYVEDCAKFVIETGLNDAANGQCFNAGSGRDISVNDLAGLICDDQNRIKHVEHIHPQSEIQKLVCDCSKTKRVLGWESKVRLEDGIKLTEAWIKEQL